MTNDGGIQKIAQIAINAKDLARATAFYRDVLGLEFLFEAPAMSFFDCGGVRLMLSLPSEAQFDHPASIVYYQVDDLHAAHERLRGAGAEVLAAPHRVHATDEIEILMAFVRDTEGNTLALSEERRIQK